MTAMDNQREMVRESFLRESAYLKISSPLFSALDKASAQDDEIVELASVIRRGQSAGQMLPAIAQFLLLKSPEPKPKLGEFYASITANARPAEEAFPVFREFCLERRTEIQELLSWRTANTNLVEKASFLLPALQHVAQQVKQPLTLLEICCSAGLNLMFDQYHYDYGAAGAAGATDSPVRLKCKVIGSGRPPVNRLPPIAQRMGVDLVAVDASSESDKLWMQAVLCPEWRDERKNLKAALAIRASHEVKTIIADAIDVLPRLLEELQGSLCILHSFCMAHWSNESKAELDALLHRVSRHREIHRLAIEVPQNEPAESRRVRLRKLVKAGIPLLRKSYPARIDHTHYVDGKATPAVLGDGDGFGMWVDWNS